MSRRNIQTCNQPPLFRLFIIPDNLVAHLRLHSFGPSNTALSCTQVTQALPSIVLITPLKLAIRLPIATAWHSTLTFTPIGTGRRYVVVKVRLTWPLSRYPGLESMPSIVGVSMSSSMAAAPPCRTPFLLHSVGVTVISNSAVCFSALAAVHSTVCSPSVSNPSVVRVVGEGGDDPPHPVFRRHLRCLRAECQVRFTHDGDCFFPLMAC